MRRTSFLLLITVAVIISPLSAQSSGAGDASFAIEDFALIENVSKKRIQLMMSVKELENSLGKPEKVTAFPKPQQKDSKWDVIEYSYSGLKVHFARGWPEIYSIEANVDSYRTRRGIRIGSKKTEVMEKYGERYLHPFPQEGWIVYAVVFEKPNLTVSRRWNLTNYDEIGSFLGLLSFEIENDRVIRIAIDRE